MSRRAKRKKKPLVQSKPNQTDVQIHYTPEELSEIISMAIINAEKIKKDLNDKERESQLNAWKQFVGLLQSREKLHWWESVLVNIRHVWCVVKISYKRREVIEGTQFLENLLIGILNIVFASVYVLLTAVSIILTFFIFFEWVIYSSLNLSWFYYVSLAILGLSIFFISRVFKIISDELYIIKDINLIFALFSCIVAFISFIVAVLALFKR